MIRINYARQIGHFAAFMLLQLPLLYKFILFDIAFGFFYIGFILFLPMGLSRTTAMIIALISGLVIDLFSNSPGIHASACVFIALVRNYWYMASIGDYDDDVNISYIQIKIWGSIKYLLPLIFTHHLIIFTIENGGFGDFMHLSNKIIMSSAYTFIVVFGISLLLAPRERST